PPSPHLSTLSLHDALPIFPHPVLDETTLAKVNRSALLIDLASKPGGINFKAAEDLGIKAIHALGIPGKTAPLTAGKIIAQVMIEDRKSTRLNSSHVSISYA